MPCKPANVYKRSPLFPVELFPDLIGITGCQAGSGDVPERNSRPFYGSGKNPGIPAMEAIPKSGMI
jgi:hypothetical protein